MDKTNDGIQFESRREVECVIEIVNEYIKRHSKSDDTTVKVAEELADKLDAIHMFW